METWYVMEDGSLGDPRDIRRDEKGRLRHADGRAVAYAPHGPRSRSVDAQAERAKAAKAAEKDAKEAAPRPAAKNKAAANKAKGRQAKPPEDRELKSSDGETR